MSKLKIGFIERRFDFFVSIEKVFRVVAQSLDQSRFTTSFQQLDHSNSVVGMILNLLGFRVKRGMDVYHVTGHCHYIALTLPSANTVLTIHDLGFLHTRKGLRRWLLKKVLLDLPVRRLRYITTISEATRDEIEKNVSGKLPDIRVIPNPLDERFLAATSRDISFDKPNILQIGTSRNKNVLRLAQALQGLNCRLTIVGVMEPELEEELNRHEIDFILRSSLSDEEMIKEYENADIVAFCSTYEGFGLPIIEAQAMRRPVITSYLSPMKDIAGEGGAVFADPYDHLSIREGIVTIIGDQNLRGKLIENGRENIKRFDKRRIASMYEALYEEIANSR